MGTTKAYTFTAKSESNREEH